MTNLSVAELIKLAYDKVFEEENTNPSKANGFIMEYLNCAYTWQLSKRNEKDKDNA